jgi:predicted GH43/DUF377 family glycosyl hydrolase
MKDFSLTRADFLKGLGAGAAVALGSAKVSARAIGAGSGWQLGPFRRSGDEPVIRPGSSAVFDDPMRNGPIHWMAAHTFNPASVVRHERMIVLFRAEDDPNEALIGYHTSRLGYASSADGKHFSIRPAPVLYPAEDSQESAEWPGGCEDPRLCEGPDGTYYVTYTQWNRKTWRLGLASSADLIHWKKRGSPFAGTPYEQLKTKSAAIIQKIEDGRMKAARIGGRYWMVFGENEIHLATSLDLVHWSPVEQSGGKLLVLMASRRFRFDSGLPEVGPPPLVTRHGIVMLYNGKNSDSDSDRDPSIAAGAYSGGQALLDGSDPTQLLARTERPFIQPELPWERSGQYKAGTTFLEGLSYFRGKLFLYYGTADTYVGLAVADWRT